MSENKHNELIDRIRKSLKKHEEPYAPGAWEGFQQHKKARHSVITGKHALGIAASLILLLSLTFILNDFVDTMSEEPVVEHSEESNVRKPGSERDVKVPHSEHGDPVAIRNEEAPDEDMEPVSASGSKDVMTSLPDDTQAITSRIFHQLNPVLLSAEAVPGLTEVQRTAEYPKNNRWPVSYQDQERHSDKIVQQNKSKNFSFGLAYAPLVNANDTKTEWSMGGGLYTEWNFTRDLALSSGVLVAQNQLEYGREEGMESVGTNNLAYVQVDLVSLEIPLNLRYYLTDNVSVSAGISSTAFLKEHYNYTYEYQREVQTLRHSEDSGFEPVTTMVTVTESDKESEPSFNAVDWAAFYTFSVGYRYDIASGHTLSLEPFMKLPSGRLTSRNIKYYTGGLQMRISF